MLQADDSLPDDGPSAGAGGAAGADMPDGDARVAEFDAALGEVMARALVVESIAWGPAVLERRARVLDALIGVLDPARAQGPVAETPGHSGGPATRPDAGSSAISEDPAASTAPAESPRPTPPAGTAENLVGACISLVHTRLLRERRGSFVALAPSLMSTIVHPYLGPEAARRELERPHAQTGDEVAELGRRGAPSTASERSY